MTTASFSSNRRLDDRTHIVIAASHSHTQNADHPDRKSQLKTFTMTKSCSAKLNALKPNKKDAT